MEGIVMTLALAKNDDLESNSSWYCSNGDCGSGT
jgi:hypothetical protein